MKFEIAEKKCNKITINILKWKMQAICLKMGRLYRKMKAVRKNIKLK